MRACESWCGLCYENARGRANHRGHFSYRPYVTLFLPETTMALKKPSVTPGGASSAPLEIDGGILGGFPELWSFLTDAAYEDGTRRQLATLLVFLHEGRLTVALNDRDNQRTVFASGDTLETILKALEGHLQCNDAEWRPNAKSFQKKSKNSS